MTKAPFNNPNHKDEIDLTIQDLLPSTSQDIYQSVSDSLYRKMCDSVGVPSPYTVTVNQTPSWSTQIINKSTTVNAPYTWNVTYDDFYPKAYLAVPQVSCQDTKVDIVMEDDSVEHITREELVKYIGERKLVQENEVVRKMYDRFQVAVKLARSDDDGDTGV